MVTAVFTDNDDYARAYGLWQWDYGQELRIQGLHLPTAVEIHFALTETGGEALTRVGTTKDGVTTVTIPDSMLEGVGATKDYQIYAWVYLSDRISGETIKRITMQVRARSKPEAFDAPGDGEIFREAIEAVNNAAKRAEDAGDKAIAAGDEAKAAAAQTAKHLQEVQGLSEQVETNAHTVAQDKQAVTGMLSQTQQAASDAALSAQAAKLSETAAAQAQTAAEAAEDTARQYAADTETDRQAVANDKQAVTQMREAVAADRKAVEQTAAQFGQAAQDALTAIGQVQSTAVGAVEDEGSKQTTAVQEAGTQAVSGVTEAKTTAVQAVTAEGDKQTKRVEDAAAGIVADREQISQNKADIATLAEEMTDLAPAIHSTASGAIITANDAAEGRPFRGLRVFGRTEQVRTTGAQLIKPIGIFPYKSNGVEVVRNPDGSYTLTGTATADGNFRIIDPDIEHYALNINEATLSLGVSGGTFDGECLVSDATNGDWTTLLSATSRKTATGKMQCNEIGAFVKYKAQTTYNVTLYPMLNSGSSALPWEPYTGGKPSPSPEYPQEMDVAGEGGKIEVGVNGGNLFPIAEENLVTTEGLKSVINPDGSITITGTPNKQNAKATKDIPLNLPIGKYYINGGEAGAGNILFQLRITYKDGTPNSYPGKTSFYVTDKVASVEGFLIYTSQELRPVNYTIYPMLNVGSVPLPFEPYRAPQFLTLTTPNGLPGIPVSKDGNYTDADGQQWICDEIDLGRGKYVQRVAKMHPRIPIVFNTREENGRCRVFDTKIWGVKWADARITALSTIAKWSSWGAGEDGTFALNSDGIYYKDSAKTLEEVNAMFAKLGTDFEVCGALAAPIESDLTPEEIAAYKALHTYSPTTVVSNDAGAGMEVTYVADTKTYIDNKFAALTKAVLDAVGGI